MFNSLTIPIIMQWNGKYLINAISADVLVASRRRVERLKDLHNDEIVDFFLTVSKCQKILEHYYQTNSATVTVQDGQFAGQTVRVC